MAIGANTAEQTINVKLYIEGISVPFEQITVSSDRRGLPTATISVPPLPGLNEIARYYLPKVHVFYRDLDYLGSEKDDSKENWKVLFTGVIGSVGYRRASGLGASASISFQCTHKNFALDGITFQYHGRGVESITDPSSGDTTVSPLTFNSQDSILQALRGIKKGASPVSKSNFSSDDCTTGMLESMSSNVDGYFHRLQGMPGVLINYWNQLKRDTYVIEKDGTIDPESMLKMYVPLLESGDASYGGGRGIRFFDRLSGHPSLEAEVEADKGPIPKKYKSSNKEGEQLETLVEISEVITPPSLKDTLKDAAGAHLATVITSMSTAFTGEGGSFPRMIQMMAGHFSYDIVTLASPAKGKNGLPAIETIFKPSMDIYYAPKCNLLTPNMYDSLQITENTIGMPTRLICSHVLGVDAQGSPLKYRAPQTIREAIAVGGTLTDSLLTSKDKVGRYEWGRGIRPQHMELPPWLQYMYAGVSYGQAEESGVAPSAQAMIDTYKTRYGSAYPTRLIPWSSDSGLNQYQRILIASLDNMWSNTIAGSRGGTVSGVFNPYAVPGYPMDIIGPDNTTPSYHAMCDSVTHTITSSSINTSYYVSSAMTFEELYTYFMTPVSPWLAAKLGFGEEMSIVGNTAGAKAASEFYAGVLGVGAVAPEAVHDFTTGRPKAIRNTSREGGFEDEPKGFQSVPNAGMELNPNLTVQGSLNLVKREVESMADYEATFGIHFVDIESLPESQSYIEETIGIADTTRGKLEPGRSPLLDYPDSAYEGSSIQDPPPVEETLAGAPKLGPSSFRDALG